MANKIKIKRGTTTTPILDTGEIAINLNNKKLSVGNTGVNINYLDETSVNNLVNEVKTLVNTITINHLNINIRDYGAKCDGVTDDTNALKQALQAAKQSGGKASIDLTYGTILISQNIVVPPLVEIYGRGIYKTCIKAKTGSSLTKILDVSSDGIYCNEFKDFTIDGTNITDVTGIDFQDTTNSVNDENSKFSNILIVNCTNPLLIGGSNRGNRFNSINIEHCVNGLIVNGTDNTFTDVVCSSINNVGITINGSNNHMKNCKAFYCNKEGVIINGNCNNLDFESQENGLSGIVVNGFANIINFVSDTNGRVTQSHNLEINGYKNIINGVCYFNSYLNGNILAHLKFAKESVLNDINLICHGNKDYITESLISSSNSLLINNKKFLTNLFEGDTTLVETGGGQTFQLLDYTFDKPWIINYNKTTDNGCQFTKEVVIDPKMNLKEFTGYFRAMVRGGKAKLHIDFYNNDSLISTFSTEELNTYHNNDSFAQVYGDIPTTATKVKVYINITGGTDGYSEVVLLDYGFTLF